MRNNDKFKSHKKYTNFNIFQAYLQVELDKAQRELKIRNYSPKTIKSYLYGLREYFSFKGSDFTMLDMELDYELFSKRVLEPKYESLITTRQ